jgi:hypothetical protein
MKNCFFHFTSHYLINSPLVGFTRCPTAAKNTCPLEHITKEKRLKKGVWGQEGASRVSQRTAATVE